MKAAYDDGGFSGGNMERPGLKRLMDDIKTGQVDVIVVYKVDRLTRSLPDFARIVDVLDARGASFVSVTQAFNTASSMGRLTLNMLLSFAQFEREVTSERIRDKIAASKAKGLWMGGPVPLGYRVESRKLIVEEADAVIVRHIFSRYAALTNGRELIEELREQGYRTKLRPQVGGPPRGGVPFSRGMLFAMLSNRIYLGDIVHKGVAAEGEHDAIIDKALWDAVQQRIAANSVERKTKINRVAPSLLAGLLRDGHGRRMSPSHAVKAGRRYRYYITHGAELRAGEPDAWRLPAHDVESAVIRRVSELLRDRGAVGRLARQHDGSPSALASASMRAEVAAGKLETSWGKVAVLGQLLDEVKLQEQQLLVTINAAALLQILGIDAADAEPLTLVAPAVRVRHGKDVKLVLGGVSAPGARDDVLAGLLAEAHMVRAAMLASPELTMKELAAKLGRCRHRMTKLLRLSRLAPEIVEAIGRGEHPPQLTPRQLLETSLPLAWNDQKAALSFA